MKGRSSSKLKKIACLGRSSTSRRLLLDGTSKSLYPDYPLAEGALVAEICNLINANLHDSRKLTCEVQYSKMLPGLSGPRKVEGREELRWQKSRADLVVSEVSLGDGAGSLK
jgi:hypothetical protein